VAPLGGVQGSGLGSLSAFGRRLRPHRLHRLHLERRPTEDHLRIALPKEALGAQAVVKKPGLIGGGGAVGQHSSEARAQRSPAAART
jgi:hypothetical protein